MIRAPMDWSNRFRQNARLFSNPSARPSPSAALLLPETRSSDNDGEGGEDGTAADLRK
jgi:hypothetical protein